MREIVTPRTDKEFHRTREFVSNEELGVNPYLDNLVQVMLRPAETGLMLRIPADYATTDIDKIMDWSDLYRALEFYRGIPCDQDLVRHLTVFESKRREDADTSKLEGADEAALKEALYASAIIPAGQDPRDIPVPDTTLDWYFGGPLQPDGRCRSLCLWKDKESALAATGGPAHKFARDLAPEMYDVAIIHSYEVRRLNNGTVTEFKMTAEPRDILQYFQRS